MLSTRTIRALKPLALVLAVAALAAPIAQAKLTPAAGKYGPLDPWAYKLIHRSAQSVPLITEHSAGQNGTALPSTGRSVPLITEHSAGQNGTGPGPDGVSRSAAASVSAAASSGFGWSDAGIGAAIAFAAMLLVIGAATFVRRSRARLASL